MRQWPCRKQAEEASWKVPGDGAWGRNVRSMPCVPSPTAQLSQQSSPGSPLSCRRVPQRYFCACSAARSAELVQVARDWLTCVGIGTCIMTLHYYLFWELIELIGATPWEHAASHVVLHSVLRGQQKKWCLLMYLLNSVMRPGDGRKHFFFLCLYNTWM